MADDIELLRRYVKDGAQAAFSELVQRNLPFVYSTALRQVGGTHRAEDVVQTVFTDLARKAGSVSRRSDLTGWLYISTCFAAAKLKRTEQRRQIREQAVHALQAMPSSDSPAIEWEQLRPILDHALCELSSRDREAVLLRFFKQLPLAAVGRQLGLSEDAARMRIDRTLDKLRRLLARRGITSTSVVLAAALDAQTVIATPVGLAASVTASALTGAAATASATGLGVFAFLSTAKITTGLVVAAAILGTGVAVIDSRARTAQSALTVSLQQQAALNAKLGDLENQLQRETQRLQLAEAQNGKLLSEANKLRSGGGPISGDTQPITAELVSARYKRAQELVRSGDPELALQELLWCYNVGMPRISSMSASRITSLRLFGELGERYPPAFTALRELRDQVLPRAQASAADFPAIQELAAINHALKDDPANLALFAQLPAGDRRRQTLASASFDYLVANQRYHEAVEGKPYSSISSTFELMIQGRSFAANNPNLAEALQQDREYTIATTATNIEVLAGTGDLVHARALADRLLAYDSSPSTKALIQQHAERAGHPNLLVSATP
jgi:RNA polymerase sigma factor (sigma-70 family)